MDKGTIKVVMLKHWNDAHGQMERGNIYTVSQELYSYLKHNGLAQSVGSYAKELLRDLGATGIVIGKKAQPQLVNELVGGIDVYDQQSMAGRAKK